jgi:hypothetical protein
MPGDKFRWACTSGMFRNMDGQPDSTLKTISDYGFQGVEAHWTVGTKLRQRDGAEAPHGQVQYCVCELLGLEATTIIPRNRKRFAPPWQTISLWRETMSPCAAAAC